MSKIKTCEIELVLTKGIRKKWTCLFTLHHDKNEYRISIRIDGMGQWIAITDPKRKSITGDFVEYPEQTNEWKDSIVMQLITLIKKHSIYRLQLLLIYQGRFFSEHSVKIKDVSHIEHFSLKEN